MLTTCSQVNTTSDMDFKLNRSENRDYNSKTIFAHKLQRTTFPTKALTVSQRFRFIPIGKNLKPTKPYVIATRKIDLKAGKPKLV